MDQSTTAAKKKQMIEDNSHMGVIFDLDGVLVDTGWAHKQSWYDLAEKEGFYMSDDFFNKTFGIRNDQIIPMFAGQGTSSEEVERLSQWKEERYRELIVENLILPLGVGELLGDLKRSGFLMAVGSSAPKANLDLVLERVKIRDFFNACVTGEEVVEGKPAPETFVKAAQKLGLPPDCCVVVEDAVQGVEAGKAAGMPVVAVTTTRDRSALSAADIIVDGLGELKAKDFAKLLKD
ncbi:MAG: HAD family phosphatase [Planctomycetes bacterium]|nr:HAD family phosphatase [Planctomycetota bacterium]MBL7147074.1 HAD family phosphatase [Phycisphaerae bacterium]